MSLFGSSGGDQELSIVIKARDEASAAFQKVDASLKSMGGGFEKAVAVSTKFAIGIAAAGVAVGAFGVASVKAASEAQTKLAKMDATLATMGKTGLVARDSILKAAAATTQLGFDDEDAAVSIANLFQRTGDLSQAMKLNSLAMDLSRSKGIDLAESQKLISLVMSGNQRALKLYGIEISDTLTPMQALAELQKKVAGQSEAFANTFEGQVAVFHKEFENLQETVGTRLLPLLTSLLKALNPIVEKLISWADDTAVLVGWLEKHQTLLIIVAGAITGALVPALIALGVTVWTVVIPAFIAAAIALAPFIIGGAIIGGIVAGVLWVIKHWDMLKEKALQIFQPIADEIQKLIDMWNKFKDVVEAPFKAVGNAFDGAAAAIGAGAPQSTFRALPSFDKGGIVPGSEGTPVPILAHGGERVLTAREANNGGDTYFNFNFHDAVIGDAGIQQVIKKTMDTFNRQSALRTAGA